MSTNVFFFEYNKKPKICVDNKERLIISSDVFYATVQLVRWGNVTFQGRVQMFYNGTWDEVCGNSWDLKDSSVVCRQLGFPGALVAVRSSDFQRTDGKRRTIWKHNVHCTGNETALQECDHRRLKRSCYGTDNVASLVCISGTNKRLLRLYWFPFCISCV